MCRDNDWNTIMYEQERKLSQHLAKLMGFKESKNALDYGEVDPSPTWITNHNVEILKRQWEPAVPGPIGLTQAIQLAKDFKLILDMTNTMAISSDTTVSIQDKNIQLAIVKVCVVILNNKKLKS